MRTPVVKRRSTSGERKLVHFFRLTMPAFGTELTSFPYAGANETCLHQTLIEVLSPRGGDGTEPVHSSGDLETYRCPPTVLVKEVAEP